MPKPPQTPPDSDIDGIHRDERRNTDVAAEQGQSAGTLDRAKKENKARPPQSEPTEAGDSPYSD